MCGICGATTFGGTQADGHAVERTPTASTARGPLAVLEPWLQTHGIR